GLLILRMVLGISFLGHGSQKLFGWFGGYGLSGTGGWMESVGLKPGKAMAFLAGAGELTGGALVLLGLFTDLGALLIAAVMVVAMAKLHIKKGFWNTNGGYEYNLTIIAAVIALASTGPGGYTIQALLGG
ncbi:MAG TPA: DoxX family protein, partial [Gemmatimonadales bacterium]